MYTYTLTNYNPHSVNHIVIVFPNRELHYMAFGSHLIEDMGYTYPLLPVYVCECYVKEIYNSVVHLVIAGLIHERE